MLRRILGIVAISLVAPLVLTAVLGALGISGPAVAVLL